MKSRKIYGIRNKATKQPWETPNGKFAWQGAGHAKSSFLTHNYPRVRAGYFDQEDCEFEVVLLGELKWEPVDSALK